MLQLIIKKNSGETIYPLKEGVVVLGREEGSDIHIEDKMISRHHAQIVRREDSFLIKDLGSANGTLLNGVAIKESPLKEGDEIRLGMISILVTRVGERGKVEPEVKIAEVDKRTTSVRATIDASDRKFLDEKITEKDKAKLMRSRQDLLTLYRIGKAITSIEDVDKLLPRIMELIFEVIKADRGLLMLLDEKSGELIRKVVRSRGMQGIEDIYLSRTIIEQVIKRGKSILSANAMDDARFRGSQSIILHEIRSAMCVPLKSKNRILGIINVDSKTSTGIFTQDDLQLLTAIGDEAGMAIENASLYKDLEALFFSTVNTLVATIETKDHYTRGHSERVTRYSLAISTEMGWEAEERRNLQLAALFHDIGKIGIPEDILNNPGEITEEGQKLIRKHPVSSAEILQNMKGLEEIIPIIRHHHEHYDGQGYPDGLKGEAIPIGARIIAVADTFDALTTNRPYRKRHTREAALEEIERCRHTQFDGKVVDALLQAHIGRHQSAALDYTD